MKVPLVIHSNTQSLLTKADTCYNTPAVLSTMEASKHNACGYTLFNHCSFVSNKNKYHFFRSEDPIKNSCVDLKYHSKKNARDRKCYLW